MNTVAVGNLVTCGTAKTKYLATEVEEVVSIDRLRNDQHSVTELKVISLGVGNNVPSVMSAPKVEKWYFTDGSMSGTGKPKDRKHVHVVGTTKLSKKVVTTFECSKIKIYE